jgi:hypothetical protein
VRTMRLCNVILVNTITNPMPSRSYYTDSTCMSNYHRLPNIDIHFWMKYKCTQTHSKFIWYVLLTYNKYISSNILLVILFIYLILFKKKEKKEFCLNCQNMQRDKTVYLRKMYILLFFGYQTYQFLPKNGK